MEEIVRILMRRDGISREEAEQAYLDCKAEIDDALIGTNVLEVEDILLNELGLEMDYIFCFI